MTQQTKHIAVLTGDIVNSTALGEVELEQSIAALAKCAKDLEWYNDAPLHFSRHRGDGWQVVLKKPEMSPRAALAFRTSLKSINSRWDTYVGVARGNHFGQIATNLNNENSQTFIDSGFALDQVKAQKTNTRMAASSLNDTAEPILNLLEFIFSGWTQKQAEVMYYSLTSRGHNINHLSETLDKSRQTIEKSLRSAGSKYIQDALLIWQDIEANK